MRMRMTRLLTLSRFLRTVNPTPAYQHLSRVDAVKKFFGISEEQYESMFGMHLSNDPNAAADRIVYVVEDQRDRNSVTRAKAEL